MEQILRALLLAAPGIAAIVGRRVNFGENPQGQPLPAIVLNTVSDLEGVSLDGADGVSVARVQVDCYADKYAEKAALSAAVLQLLNGYAGDRLQGIMHAGTRNTRDGGANETARPWRASLDFEITFNMEG